MDSDVRALWKTRPWEGVVVSLGLGVLLANSLANGSIRFGNSRNRERVVMRWEEQPVDFAIVMSVLFVIFAGFVGYTVFRFRRRARFRREDGDAG